MDKWEINPNTFATVSRNLNQGKGVFMGIFQKKKWPLGITMLITIVMMVSIAHSKERTTPEGFEKKTSQLAEIVKTHVIHLDRNLFTFHYERKNNYEPKNFQDIEDGIRGVPEVFYNTDIYTGDMVGPGFYTAIDPVSSRSYGDDRPQLYALVLKKGTITFIESSTEATPEEKKIIKSIYDHYNCHHQEFDLKLKVLSDVPYKDEQKSILGLRGSTTPICRKIVIEAFKKLNIQAILYAYEASQLQACRYRSEAINIISSEAINFNQSSFYSNESVFDQSGYDKMILKLYQEAELEFKFQMQKERSYFTYLNFPSALLSNSTSDEVTPVDLKTFKDKFILNCGPNWAFETAESNNAYRLSYMLFKNRKQYLKDKEVQNLFLLAARTYAARFKSQNFFDLENLDFLVKKIFSVTVLPEKQNFYDWLKAGINSYNSDESMLEALLFYDSKATISLAKKIRNPSMMLSPDKMLSFLKNHENDPDAFSKLLVFAGYPSKYVQRIMFGIRIGEGLIPLLFPLKGMSFEQNVRYSKEFIVNNLEKCIEMYNDSKISYEEIQKSQCAILDFKQ